MQISSNYSNKSNKLNNSRVTQSSNSKTQKSSSVETNKPVNAEVSNLTRNNITLSLADGTKITGKIQNPEQITIGLNASFSLSYNESGDLTIELLSKENLQNKALFEALKALGFNASEENLELVDLLLKNQFPITKENLSKLNQALKMFGKDINKAMFFMENEIKLNSKTANQFNNIVNHENMLDNQIKDFVSNILKSKLDIENIFTPFLKDIPKSELVKLSQINKELYNLINENTADKSLENQSEISLKSQLSKEQLNALFSSDSKNATATKTDLKTETNVNNQNNNFTEFVKLNKDNILSSISKILENNSYENLSDELKKLGWEKDFNIKELFDTLFKENSDISKKAVELFTSKSEILNKISKSILFDIKSSKSEDLKDYFNNLYQKLNETKDNLVKLNSFETKQILSDIENINNNLEFMSYSKNNLFFQIPININDKNLTAELYVFKDKKTKKTNDDSLSALIALDLSMLGHFEAYIQKRKQSVICQFRIENKNIENLINSNIKILYQKLKDHNLNLDNYSFKQINESFSIVDKEPSLQNNIDYEKNIKNISFDIRT